MKLVLYSNGCVLCDALKQKLDCSGLAYTQVSDLDVMQELGLTHVPVLSADGQLFNYAEALKWLERNARS